MKLHPGNLRKLFSRSWWAEKRFQLHLRRVAGPPQSAGIEGFLDPIEERCLQWAAAQAPPGGTIVEVGSYHGKSAVNLAYAARRRGDGTRVFCVDTWRNTTIEHAPNVDVFDRFLENTARYRDVIATLRGRSAEVGNEWNRGGIDVLFIDGDHSFEGVTADIRAWVPHVKPGGLVLFHDSDLPDVRRGIDACKDLLRPSRERKAWSIQVYWKGQ
jgi:predicted O-methyltransferase YrrM